jgi:hypothetical protein
VEFCLPTITRVATKADPKDSQLVRELLTPLQLTLGNVVAEDVTFMSYIMTIENGLSPTTRRLPTSMEAPVPSTLTLTVKLPKNLGRTLMEDVLIHRVKFSEESEPELQVLDTCVTNSGGPRPVRLAAGRAKVCP